MLGPHIEHGGFLRLDFDLIFMIYWLLILLQVLVIRSVSPEQLTWKLGTPHAYVPYFVHTENVTFVFDLKSPIKNINIEPICENEKQTLTKN